MEKPRLLAISGPLNGSAFAVEKNETLIGRDRNCDIRIVDRSISRRHCLLKFDGKSYSVSDLDSFNGTFVNGVAIRQDSVKHGDRVTFGDVSFLFLEAGRDADTGAIEFASDITGGSTIRLAHKDAIYLNAARLGTSETTETAARHLASLVELNIRLTKLRDVNSVQTAVLDAVFDVLPAENGAFLLFNGSLDDVTSAYRRSRQTDSAHPLRVSRTIADQVISEVTCVLCTDVQTELSGAASLVAARTDSLLCVPLTKNDRVVGLIYLDSNDPGNGFGKDHLEFLTAVAAVASVVLENVARIEILEGENQRLREEIELRHNIIGQSAPMKRVFTFVEKAAPTDATVLIRGESGTGKELVAHAIHENSERAHAAFVAINCAVLSESLLESELFGHERGAFTTAVALKKGKLEIADGGTLFLDELGEMSLATQAKLLRFLQEREFERVGGTKTIKVDVRIIAATNRNLDEEIRNGSFRQDLYYRLNVVSFAMPPLRERREDIADLVNFFIGKFAAKCRRKVSGIEKSALDLLSNHEWPGNVRELENAIERAIVLGSSETILPEDLPESILESTAVDSPVLEYQSAVNEMKKDLIVKTLASAGGNYAEAARILGLHPANLHRLIRTLGIKELLK